MADLIDRQAAIDVAFDTFPDDEYFREQFVKGIEALPSAQPDAIPIEWIEKKIEWLKGLDNEFAALTARNISAMLNQWRGEQNETN